MEGGKRERDSERDAVSERSCTVVVAVELWVEEGEKEEEKKEEKER